MIGVDVGVHQHSISSEKSCLRWDFPKGLEAYNHVSGIAEVGLCTLYKGLKLTVQPTTDPLKDATTDQDNQLSSPRGFMYLEQYIKMGKWILDCPGQSG